TYSAEAALKDLTSELIGRFCGAAHDATRLAAGDGPLTRYDTDLVIPEQTLAEILVLKGIAVYYVMAPREMEPVYLDQRTTLFDLVDALYEGGPELLEVPFANSWRACNTDAEKLRVVIDQVASLTDISAYQWHGRICGMLSGI
ncbi:MAG: deoxyguanosinetriphosphate triphosphohydrolase, partial [Winkia neuii]|nr:deoxyguanosinetriphosphate triphosphohydrolase [Winkia neuii]